MLDVSPTPKSNSKRALVAGGVARVVGAPGYRRWEDASVWFARQIRVGRQIDTLLVPIVVSATFVMPRPKTVLKREGTGRKPSSKRPDMSNLCKALDDVLERSGWIADDSQIVEYRSTRKVRAAEGEQPKIEIELWEAKQ